MAKRLCLGFGDQRCTRLTGRTRCPEHERMHEAQRRPNRPTARERGYDTEYDTNRVAVLAASRVCWICRHDGADQADHYPIPRGRPGANAITNLRPAHGTQPCQTCGMRCNQSRGTRPHTA